MLGGVYSGWQTRLDEAYEKTVITGHAVSPDGRFYSGLMVPIDNVRLIKKVDGVGDVFISLANRYYVSDDMPRFSDNSFGMERREAWKRSGAEVVALNDLRAAKNFYYSEPQVEWLDGWDDSFFTEYECVQFANYYTENGFSQTVPAVVGRSFMEDHGLAHGDSFTVNMIESNLYFDGEKQLTLQIVGSYRQIDGETVLDVSEYTVKV